MEASALEATLRRDRLTVATGLALITIAAWAWTLASALRIGVGEEMGMAGNVGAMAMTVAMWSPAHAALIFIMWWVMMAAMMLPSAAPLILLAIAIQRRKEHDSGIMAGLLVAGYLTVWGAFSLMATAAQWALESSGAVNPNSMTAGSKLAGTILLACGLYQFAPLKRACLRRCRSPLEFLTVWWRPTAQGALRTGLIHGAFCLGCCWFLMALLFVGGVMNPLWIGGIALYVLLEKFVPHGVAISRAIGVILLLCGALTLSRTV